MNNFHDSHPLITVAAIGAIAGLGKLLISNEPITIRLAVGRAISSSLLGVSAGTVMVWIPDISYTALVGLSAALASLGTSAIERLLQRFIGK